LAHREKKTFWGIFVRVRRQITAGFLISAAAAMRARRGEATMIRMGTQSTKDSTKRAF
jgi:hypothetical protein